jgi:stage V sporulation protein B
MAQNKLKLVEHRLQQSIRLSIVSGGLACVVLYIFAEPLMLVMYGSSQSAIFVKVMAPFFIFQYFQGPLQAVLQALDLAKAAMVNSLIGAAVKTALIFVLATRPSLGIMGAALAIVIGIMLVTLLHFATVMKVSPFTIYVKDYFKSGLTMVASGFVGYLFYENVLVDGVIAFRLIAAISVTSIFYCILLLLLNLVEKDEIKRIPYIGGQLSRLIPVKK